MDEVAKLTNLKRIVDSSFNQTLKDDSVVELELVFSPASFELAYELASCDLVESIYSFNYNNRTHTKNLSQWANLPDSIKGLNITSFFIEFNFKNLRINGIHAYKNEHELVELCPMAPDRFFILNLSLNSNKCTICPDDYNKNEILRYFQLRQIWTLLSSFSDDNKESELVFLYRQKLCIKLNYTFDDLASEFDGLSRLLEINDEDSHADARKNIMQNTLHSILWKEDSINALKILIKKFTVFVKTFEENYRAFTVGFSFDKVRKEYVERFRDYLSKMNSMIYESLTRALAIPITGLISFVVMSGDDSYKAVLINLAALILVVFSTIGTHFLVLFQMKMVSVTRNEFDELFREITNELMELDMSDLGRKSLQLHEQANTVCKLLISIYAVAMSNLIINIVMFTISTL